MDERSESIEQVVVVEDVANSAMIGPSVVRPVGRKWTNEQHRHGQAQPRPVNNNNKCEAEGRAVNVVRMLVQLCCGRAVVNLSLITLLQVKVS